MSDTGLIGILHPVIITRDFAGALKFYRDLLGFVPRPVTTHDPDKIARLGGPLHAEAQAVILHAPDGSELEIACFTKPGGAERSAATWTDAGIRSITFRVTDIDAMLRRLRQAGHAAVNEVVAFVVEGASVRVAYVHGPDGVILTLIQESAA